MAKGEMCRAQNANKSGSGCNPGEGTYIYEMAFVSHATREFRELALQGKRHEETRKIITKYIASAKNEMIKWFEQMDINVFPPLDDLVIDKGKGPHDNDIVLDPVVAKTRGTTNAQKSHWQRKKGGRRAQNSSELFFLSFQNLYCANLS